MPAVDSPRLQAYRREGSLAHFQLCLEAETCPLPDVAAESAKCGTGIGNSAADLLSDECGSRESAAHAST